MIKEKLSSLCKISNGFAFRSNDYVNNGYRVMRITNVQKGFIADNDPKFIPNEIADKADNFKLSAGDILVSLTGNVGRVGRVLSQHLPAVLNQRVGLIRPISPQISAKYLFQFLNSDQFEREAVQNSNGVAQLNLSSKWVENYKIPLPPLDDQKRIAHLLGKVEGLIAQRKHHLQQLDDLLKSVFLEMFGDLPLDTTLGKECVFSQGIQIPVEYQKSEQHVGYIRFLRIIDYTQTDEPRYIEFPGERYCVNEDDIVMVRYGASAGFVGIGKSGAIANNLFKFNFDKNTIRPIFLYFLLKTQRFYSFIKKKVLGAAMPALSFGIMNDYQISIPPIDLQNQFAAIVEKVEALKSRYQQSLTDLENLYGALSQKAFKGELDLSRVVLPAEGSKVAEEEKIDVEKKQPLEPSFELPAPEELTVLQTIEGRKSMLGVWLNAWLEQLGNAPFVAQDFMDAARQRLWELSEDDAPNWGAVEYDELKAWVFEALEQGHLTQGYDDANNRVQITAVKG